MNHHGVIHVTRAMRLLSVALMGLCVGCATTQYERHYFGAADLDAPDPVLKFYRITIKAQARNMKTDYKAGFYDANAVRALFGEVKSDKGSAAPTTQAGKYKIEYRDGRWVVDEPDALFTVVYGTDASALTKQIQAFADSDDAANAFTQLLGAAAAGDLYLNVDEVKSSAVDLQSRTKLAADKLNEIADALTPTGAPSPAPAVIKQKLQEAAILVANAVGPSVGLPTIPSNTEITELRKILDQITSALLQRPSQG